jgi:antirestriction protein
VTNLGKYNEGQLVGAPLKFPTTTEAVQDLLKRIGIDGVRYEEIFITEFESDVLGLYDHLGEYESIDELNHLACLLSELSQDELAVFEAVMDSGEYTGSVKDLINLSQNLDSYSFYSDVHTEEDLGRMYLQELEAVPVPEHLIDYIDYEAYGRDARINEGGHFAPGGYVQGGHSFKEHYHGLEDIPDEHRVFSMPKVPIREQMAAYQEMANRASQTTEQSAPKVDREER